MENKDLQNSQNGQVTGRTQEAADFSAIFNVASEEQSAQPVQKPVNPSATAMPKIDTPQINNVAPVQISDKKPSAPKKKNAFNGEERVLYEMKPEKEASVIVPILFFVVLITFILLLPVVSKKVEFRFLKPTTVVTPEDQPTEEFYYFDRSTVRAKIDGLEMTNFVMDEFNNEFRLSFTLTNAGDKTYQFDKKYYIVLYNEDKIVYRALIHSYDVLGSMAATTMTLNISQRAYNEANRFKIEEIPTASYPEVNLVTTSGDYKVLQCTYLNNSIKYYFLEDGLVRIEDLYVEKAFNNKNFNLNKATYKDLANKYKKVNGFETTFVETAEEFRMLNNFNLNEIPDMKLTELETYRFFRYKTSKEIVSFELEAQAYNCG